MPAFASIESLEPRRLLAATGTGLMGNYYNNANFTGTQRARMDASINFNWGTGGPVSGIAGDTFVVRWTGQVQPAYGETYTFKTVSDDGVRLWIEHQPVISNWGATGLTTNTGSITLRAGKKYDILLEFREKTGSAGVQFYWSSPSQPQVLVPTKRMYPGQPTLLNAISHALAFAQGQLKQTLADLGTASTRFPSITDTATGLWKTVDHNDWTAGFFAGTLWQMHQYTVQKSWRLEATRFTKMVEPAKVAGDDLGFRFIPSYLALYRSQLSSIDRQVLLAAAASKVANFNPTVGMFESVNFKPPGTTDARANFPVLMDHTMDLELVYEAAELNGNADWINKANAHLAKLQATMVRADGSTAQWGYFYDQTGQLVATETRQGISGNSTWSRGQAWGMYSFVTAYAQTGRADFLATAKKLCDYWVANVPPDGVPYWDFDVAPTSTTPKDSSAAAVAASAMVRLASLLAGVDPVGAAKYKTAAEKILSSLTSPGHLAEGSISRGLLLHGASYVAKGRTDNSLIYGDYYFLEAMNRYRGLRI